LLACLLALHGVAFVVIVLQVYAMAGLFVCLFDGWMDGWMDKLSV